MAFRTDIEDFPFDCRKPNVWYLLIDYGDKTEKEFTTVQDKKDLVVYLSKIVTEKSSKNFQLFGVWNGQYRTDIFKIPIEIGFGKIKEHFQ